MGGAVAVAFWSISMRPGEWLGTAEYRYRAKRTLGYGSRHACQHADCCACGAVTRVRARAMPGYRPSRCDALVGILCLQRQARRRTPSPEFPDVSRVSTYHVRR